MIMLHIGVYRQVFLPRAPPSVNTSRLRFTEQTAVRLPWRAGVVRPSRSHSN